MFECSNNWTVHTKGMDMNWWRCCPFIPIFIVSNHVKNLLFKKFSFLSGFRNFNLSFSQGPGWSDFSCKGWLKRFEISEVRAISSWEGWSVGGDGFHKMDEISHWFNEQFEDWWFNEQFEDWENESKMTSTSGLWMISQIIFCCRSDVLVDLSLFEVK